VLKNSDKWKMYPAISFNTRVHSAKNIIFEGACSNGFDRFFMQNTGTGKSDEYVRPVF
jgi:hypothetical protein